MHLEMMAFFEPCYQTEFKEVSIVRDADAASEEPPIVRVVMHGDDDSNVWTIQRSHSVFVPPRVTKNGVLFVDLDCNWTPALTTSKWLLMLATA